MRVSDLFPRRLGQAYSLITQRGMFAALQRMLYIEYNNCSVEVLPPHIARYGMQTPWDHAGAYQCTPDISRRLVASD